MDHVKRSMRIKMILLHLWFPNRCPFCDTCIPYDAHCCDMCQDIGASPIVCRSDALDQQLPYDRLYARFPYEGKMADAVKNLKFMGWQQNAEHLAYYACQMLSADSFDLITYVPMHPKKQRQRGFNQAKKLADSLYRRTGIPVEPCLIKQRETEQQHTLGKRRRAQNLAGAFITNKKVQVQQKHILLVDDVFTTGQTVRECAQVLKQAGAREITVATICKTVHNRMVDAVPSMEPEQAT